MEDPPETCSSPPPPAPEAQIHHLVLSGGVHYGLCFFGVIKRLHERGRLDVKTLRSIHATSAGSVTAAVLAAWRTTGSDPAPLDWTVLENYLIQRPWQKVFHFSLEVLLNSYEKGGLFDRTVIEDILRPIFAYRDLDITQVTLREFYEVTQLEVHFFTVNLLKFRVVDLSYKTHPDWRVLDAVYVSAAAPGMFAPFWHADTQAWYADGAFLVHYPIRNGLQWCQEHQVPRTELLGVNILVNKKPAAVMDPPPKMTLLQYVYLLTKNVLNKISLPEADEDPDPAAPAPGHHEIHIPVELHLESLYAAVMTQEERTRLIASGAEHADRFLEGS